MKHIIFSFSLLLAILAGSVAGSSGAQPSTSEVQKQIAVLKSNASEKEKADACRELARTGTEEAIAPLATLLLDPKMSHMARYALEPMPGSAVDKVFRDALGKTQGRTQAGVIGSIGVRGDEKAVSAVSALLQNSDPEVAQASARALGKIGDSAAVKALQKALPTAGELQKLHISEGLFRAAEKALVARQTNRAVAIYDGLRTQTAHQVRTAALRGAVLARGPGGIPLIMEALRGSDFSQVEAAARIAQELSAPEVTRALADELPRLSADKQIVVIQTLGQRKDPKAMPELVAATKKGPKEVRLAAVAALPQIGDAKGVPALVSLLRDADTDIARAAKDNLAGLPGQETDAAVTQMLTSKEPAQILIGLELAARRRLTSAKPFVLKLATADEPQVRVAALKRLGELCGPGEVPALLDLLGTAKTPEDLEATEQALGAICANASNRDACVEALTARLGRVPTAQKCALVRVLTGTGGTKALSVVRASVNDSNPEVRAASIRALSTWSSTDAAPDLLELARSSVHPTEKMVALRGYLDMAKRGELNEAQRLAMCREAGALVEKPEEKRLLLAALGDISSTESVELIEPYLAGDSTKEEASTAVVGIAQRLLRNNKTPPDAAAKLIEPLNKVAGATGNADLADRAKKLADQAKQKAGK